MTSSRLHLTGIRARGRHGASPGERDEEQDFSIDLEVEVRVGGDTLSETADYRALAAAARDTVEGGSFVLLESIARAVADAVQQVPGVTGVRAVVHKPRAASSVGAGDVAAEASAG
jgi:dihydroneopterin aldolase